jgi:hypothetical protein
VNPQCAALLRYFRLRATLVYAESPKKGKKGEGAEAGSGGTKGGGSAAGRQLKDQMTLEQAWGGTRRRDWWGQPAQEEKAGPEGEVRLGERGAGADDGKAPAGGPKEDRAVTAGTAIMCVGVRWMYHSMRGRGSLTQFG